MAATIPLSSASASPVILARRYRLERRLAQGGMAEVWVATDLSLSRQVAVKLLKPSLAADPVVAERFRREAIAVAQLSHPNIVAVFDAIEDVRGSTRRQAVVMQLVSGKSLRQLLDEQRRLSPALTMHIGKCVAAALDCAHRANLVHRDVKPGNILVTPDGSVLLTDFGIAKGIDDGDDLTSPNIMMGTAKYLSPEQVRGNRLDGRADLYSLGLVLYECLAGRVPFLGETDADTALARLNRDPTDLTRLRPTLPDGLAELIHRLLARDPADRVATGADVRNELMRIDGTPARDRRDPGDTPSGATPPPRRTEPDARPDARTDHRRLFDDEAEGTPTAPDRPLPPRPDPAAGAPTRPAPATPGPRPPQPHRGPVRPNGARPPSGRPAPPAEPRVRTGRPAGPPVIADRTPPNPKRPAGRPNREYETRNGPTMVVLGALVLIATIVAAFLWNKMNDDAIPGNGLPTVDVTSVNASSQVSATAAPVAVPTIVALTGYDPDGDGEERQDAVALALDGDPSTAWETVCYQDRFLGAKGRVGLVVDMGAVTQATLRITITSAPSQVRIFSAGGDSIPATWDAWGADIARYDDDRPMVIDVTIDGRWALIGFYELGESASCVDNPYRGAIAEIAVVA